MSNLKIEFNIDTENPQDVTVLANFVSSLNGEGRKPATTPASGARKLTAKKPATKKPATKKTPPAEIEVVEAETVGTDEVTIEGIRELMGKKLIHHRDAAKAELKRLGSNNVTSLDKGKYGDFHAFLSGLVDPK